MKHPKTSLSLILTVAVVGILSYIFAGLIFKVPAKNAKAPSVESINQNFPDVAGDPAYSSIFSDKALDPTQIIQIGDNSNNQPFVGP